MMGLIKELKFILSWLEENKNTIPHKEVAIIKYKINQCINYPNQVEYKDSLYIEDMMADEYCNLYLNTHTAICTNMFFKNTLYLLLEHSNNAVKSTLLPDEIKKTLADEYEKYTSGENDYFTSRNLLFKRNTGLLYSDSNEYKPTYIAVVSKAHPKYNEDYTACQVEYSFSLSVKGDCLYDNVDVMFELKLNN
ncbi:MAG: hypothetical protein ACRCTZ_05700 [Sarcina sp.]